MSKQIMVKSTQPSDLLVKMYTEATKYLENIGFIKTPLISVTDKNATIRTILFSQGREKVMIEYKRDVDEVLKLVFKPLEIKFVHDILLMRFNQLSKEQKGSVFIYNN